MKINRNVAQISITALLTSAVFTTYIIISHTYHGASEAITWEQARTLMNEYQGRNPIMMTTYTETGTTRFEKLKGFKFDKSDIMDLLTSSSGTPEVKADTLLLMFGTAGTFLDANDVEWPNMHIIAFGTHNNVTLIGGPIYDRADPCPPNCPQ
jgi:hypothetical protein